MDTFALAWLIPALPFAAFAIVGMFTQRRREPSAWLVIAATAVACAISWMIFFRVLGGETSIEHPWQSAIPWLALSVTTVLPFGILIDPLSTMMLVVVTTVSLLIQIYSRGYLWEPAEEHAEGGHGEAHIEAHGPDEHSASHADEHHGPPGALVLDPNYGRFFAYLGLFTAAMLQRSG